MTDAPEGPEDATPRPAADPYRELFERSADAILIIDRERFVDCNQATVSMLRYDTKEALLRTHPSELSPPTQPDGQSSFEKANAMMALAFARGSHRFEWDHVRRGGEVFPVEVLLTAVERDGRQILHVVWRDITDRRRLEEQLRHVHKMEAIGTLAGGIAHDFNNLLVAILVNAEMLQRQLHDQPELREYTDEVLKAGQRAATLVRQLLTFSRKQDTPTAVIDPVAVLRDVHRMLGRLISEHIELVIECPDAPLRIRGSAGQVEQVIINLATNARDAMPAGGTLTIELRPIVVATDSIGAGDRLAPGPYAVLSVSDTGTGMTDDVLARAIDPFFTTKAIGEGTGLGLSTVYGIARHAGGDLRMDSVVGRGSRARVFLPLHPDAPLARAPGPSAPAAVGGHERVLVVEDDEAVAQVVVGVLTGMGYQVRRAHHGVEALALCLLHPDQLDLMVTDVVMPQMGGPALVEALRAQSISVPVLFISGHTTNARQALDQLAGCDLLEKPFTGTELVARVRQLLDRPRPVPVPTDPGPG